MQKSLVIDANLLLLLVIGSLDEGRLISSSKRLSKFTKQDYLLLLEYMSAFRRLLITPYLLTEVSNLIDLKGSKYYDAYRLIRILLADFYEEQVVLSKDIHLPAFITHGITDASLVELVKQHVVLTDDERMLPLLYEANGDNVMPFQVLRSASKGV